MAAATGTASAGLTTSHVFRKLVGIYCNDDAIFSLLSECRVCVSVPRESFNMSKVVVVAAVLVGRIVSILYIKKVSQVER